MEESVNEQERMILLDFSQAVKTSLADFPSGQLPNSQQSCTKELTIDNLLPQQSSEKEPQLSFQNATEAASQGILIHRIDQQTDEDIQSKDGLQEEIVTDIDVIPYQTKEQIDLNQVCNTDNITSAKEIILLPSTQQPTNATSNNHKETSLIKPIKIIEINQHTQIESITKQLSSSPDFDALSFKFFKGSIKSPCFKSISTMLSHNIHSPLSTLEFICLNCDLNSNDLSFILQSITAFKDQSLIKGVSLNLKGNRLNKRGILFLCECIKSMGDYTKKWKIILSDNPQIQENHNSNHCEQLLESISMVDFLQELILDVSYTLINANILTQAARILKLHCQTIQTIHMIFDECLQITQAALNQLLSVLSGAQDQISLQIVSLGLGMDVMQISKDNRKLLIKTIKHHSVSLTCLVLHLSYTRVSLKFLIQLSNTISTLNNLKVLEVNVKGNQVDSITFRHFIRQSIPLLQNLISLSIDFSVNCILGVELQYLTQTLQNLRCLKEIHVNLSKNVNFMRFPVALCETIQRKQLKGSLTMQECNIPQDVVMRISNMFSSFVLKIDRQ